jgi:uncharacterized protein involved in type VI secretion and phage assembly
MTNIFELMTADLAPQERAGKMFGVVIGVVTNNQDPDKLGRVKMRFPWLDEEDESNWARIATTMAGNNRGTFFLPEVDDEVLVAFEHGNTEKPYVVGALWNGVDAPVRDNADGKNNQRVIRSRAGHEFILNDEDGKEQVEIKTKAGHQFLLDDTSGSEKIAIVDKSGNNKIEIDTAQNSIAISAQTKITLKAPTVEITADSEMTAKSAKVEISSDGPATVKSSAMLTIQGSMVKIN